MVEQQAPVITIDGPSGSGKGTVSQLLAEKLGWHYLDSGALYRALAVAAQQKQVAVTEEDELAKLAGDLQVSFIQVDQNGYQTWLAGRPITEELRSEACSKMASQISALPKVRQALVAWQQAYRRPPGLVTDGRDMGTIIFPDASLKIFLTASAEERAHRRYNQLKEKGNDVSLNEILTELIARDKRDRERKIAPLMPAKDAVVIDTTQQNISQVLLAIYKLAKVKFEVVE